jgi:hypothetical protein
MKNLILIIGLFVASNTIAQLEVNAQKDSILFERTGMAALSPITIHYFEDIDSYGIIYKNNEYSQITVMESLSIGTKENLVQLMELCLRSAETKEEFKTDLYLIDRFSKKAVRVFTNEGVFYINTKECQTILDRLK